MTRLVSLLVATMLFAGLSTACAEVGEESNSLEQALDAWPPLDIDRMKPHVVTVGDTFGDVAWFSYGTTEYGVPEWYAPRTGGWTCHIDTLDSVDVTFTETDLHGRAVETRILAPANKVWADPGPYVSDTRHASYQSFECTASGTTYIKFLIDFHITESCEGPEMGSWTSTESQLRGNQIRVDCVLPKLENPKELIRKGTSTEPSE